MTKESMLELIKLLSSVESWSFAEKHLMPAKLYERIDSAINELSKELLK